VSAQEASETRAVQKMNPREDEAQQGVVSNTKDARRVGIVKDPRYLDHVAGPFHPESPDRLRAIYDLLGREEYKNRYRVVAPRMASLEELAWNHTSEYIEIVAATAELSSCNLDPDTGTSAQSWDAARLAVGGLFSALDVLASDDLDAAFALVRPPGHHAEVNRARGFCLFNNVALGAHYGRRMLGYERVLVVDWDLHHGNGTQQSFYADPNVLYFSIHQYPYFPGSGSLHEIGIGEGAGFTVNIPLYPGAGDAVYAALFNQVLKPIGESFNPDLIIVSAGFDIGAGDPLGGMAVSTAGFAYLSRVIVDLADAYCEGRVLFSLEGGYLLRELTAGVAAVLSECERRNLLDEETETKLKHAALSAEMMAPIRTVHADHWPVLESA
jgi:acetoin utilization deacetylase AcuC-like enzyme